jgi:hypothetical protein
LLINNVLHIKLLWINNNSTEVALYCLTKELFMEVIDDSMLDQISGGRGNNRGDRTDNGGRNNNKGRGASTNYGGQANGFVGNSSPGMDAACAAALAAGALGGAFGGVRGAVGGAIGAVSSCINTGNGGGGGTGSNSNCGGNSGNSCSR